MDGITIFGIIVLIYALICFGVSFVYGVRLKHTAKLLMFVVFFSPIIVSTIVSKLFSNENITAIVNISSLFLASSAMAIYSVIAYKIQNKR